MSRVYRFAIANIAAAMLVDSLKAAGYSGTVQPDAVGFSQEWPNETGVVLEVATERCAQLMATVARLLTLHGESAAYMTVDGSRPQLLYSDGKQIALHDALTMEVAA